MAAVPPQATAPGVVLNPPPPITAAVSRAAVDEARFGLDKTPEAAPAITSRIPGTFEGWDGNSRIRLANGQVWRIVDSSSVSVYLQEPAVRVERTVFGGYRMEIQGVKTAPRVQRVQ